MNIIFFGTSAFAARILTFLMQNQVNILAVVTRQDKPKGRRLELSAPPVKETVHQLFSHLPVLQPFKVSTPEFADQLKQYQPDLFLVVAYGEILRQFILDIPKQGCVNIHASLLPLYRGAAPMQRSLMDGVLETGITLIAMSAQMDAGDVFATQSIPVAPNMILGELDNQLCEVASFLTLDLLRKLEIGSVRKTPQNHKLATIAPKIGVEATKICWQLPAHVIHNLIRALSPLPGAWCEIHITNSSGTQTKRLKIKRSAVAPGLRGEFGKTISCSKEEWIVACGEEALSILEVQLEGKKTMPIAQFLRGNLNCSFFLT